MARTVADQFAYTLAAAGIKRVYGIVGDSLNGLTDSSAAGQDRAGACQARGGRRLRRRHPGDLVLAPHDPFVVTIDEAAQPRSNLASTFWGEAFVLPLMLSTAVSYSVFRGKVRSAPEHY